MQGFINDTIQSQAKASQNKISATHAEFWKDPNFWIAAGVTVVVSAVIVIGTVGLAAPEVAIVDTGLVGGEADSRLSQGLQ